MHGILQGVETEVNERYREPFPLGMVRVSMGHPGAYGEKIKLLHVVFEAAKMMNCVAVGNEDEFKI